MAASPKSPVQVTVLADEGGKSRYNFFEVESLSASGAVLLGQLLFEQGEMVNLELSWSDGSKLVVEAHVDRAQLEHPSSVTVHFHKLEPKEQKILESKLD